MCFLSAEKGLFPEEILRKNTRVMSKSGRSTGASAIAGAAFIYRKAFSSPLTLLASTNLIAMIAVINPTVIDPVSPIKIRALRKLKYRNPSKAPARAKHKIECV